MLINEMFLSIQGEGIESGKPTFFIRTGICNLQCSWCDTKFKEPVREMTLPEIISQINNCGVKEVCITGGEPLLDRDFPALEKWLFESGYNALIETNGSLSIEGIRSIVSMDIKPPSSGMADRFLKENLAYLQAKDQVKFVIGTIEDYEYAVDYLHEIKLAEVIFMPVWDKKNHRAKELARWIIRDALKVRLSLQVNKILALK